MRSLRLDQNSSRQQTLDKQSTMRRRLDDDVNESMCFAKSHRGQIEDKEAERDNEELIEAMNSKLLLSKPMEMMSSVSGKLTAIIMALLLVNEYRR